MREQTLQTQIQDIVDEAINRIHALTRQWIIQEVEATFEGAEGGPVKAPKKSAKGKKAAAKRPKRELSPQAKANLMKNLQKAWKARSKQAAALREQKKPASSTSSKKKPKRATRKPAQDKKK